MITSKPNLLLLSAGRRVELIKAFKLELRYRKLSSKIFAADLKPTMSAACQFADESFFLPRANSPNYVNELLSLCKNYGIGLVVPTIDTELLVLAQHREQFADAGICIVVSDESFVAICRDKRLTAKFFESVGIAVPKILDSQSLKFPCFVKPYDGSRSIGAMKLSKDTDLSQEMLSNSKLMYMEFVDSNFDEFTVDFYYSNEGNLRCLVPRIRLEIRDGEVSKSVTCKNHIYEYLLKKMAKIQGARGCLTVQLFANPKTFDIAALEINPRFGGGYPLSYAAGATYPGWLIDEYILHKDISFFDKWNADLMMLRYDAHVLVRYAD